MVNHSEVQRASRTRRNVANTAAAIIGRPRVKPQPGDALRLRNPDQNSVGLMNVSCGECGALFFYNENIGSNCCSEYAIVCLRLLNFFNL